MAREAIKVRNLGKRFQRSTVTAPSVGRLSEEISEAFTGVFKPRIKSSAENSSGADFWAIRDVTFDVFEGEAFGIIGRNGAGKSTLLKVLSRVFEPTEGSAELIGRVSSLLEVGVGFHPELTGRENVFLNAAILGLKRQEIQSRFDEIVDFAEVDQFIDNPLKTYSSGMQVRLAFAVAATLEPEVLIIDEALAVGDAAFQQKCLRKMRDISSAGRTILFVSHNSSLIANMCQRVLYLSNGQVKACGPTATILPNYIEDMSVPDNLDLGRARRPHMGAETRFNMVSLNMPSATYFVGQELGLSLSIESDLSQKDLSIGTTVANQSGEPVATLFTEQTFDVDANTLLEISLQFSVNLTPGHYQLNLSIGRGGLQTNRLDLDYICGMPTFQILPLTVDGTALGEWPAHSYGHLSIRDSQLVVQRKNIGHAER